LVCDQEFQNHHCRRITYAVACDYNLRVNLLLTLSGDPCASSTGATDMRTEYEIWRDELAGKRQCAIVRFAQWIIERCFV